MEIQATIDTLGGVSGGDNCTGQTQEVYNPLGFGNPIYNPNGTVSYNTTMTLPCQDRCNWLYSLSDSGYYGKQAIQYDIESKEYHGMDMINLKIKFYDDYLDFNIESGIVSDDLNISVSSLQGFNLVSNKFRLQKGENQYQIQTQKLITGIYFISLQVNGLLLKTEKFILIR